MTSCEYCGNQIKKDIKKCHFCGSFQGMKGKIAHWGNIISVLLALISILALVLPPAITTLKGDYSEVSATIVSADFGNYEILLTNTGNRPSVLIGASIEVKKDGRFIATFPIDLGDNYRKVISEDKSSYVNYRGDLLLPALAEPFLDRTGLEKNDCFLEIRFSQFNALSDKEVVKYKCLFIPPDVQIPILEAARDGRPVPGLTTVIMSGRKHYLLPTKESIAWAREQLKLNSDTGISPPVN